MLIEIPYLLLIVIMVNIIKISYNNNCYKIGAISGQGIHFFARRVNTENKDNFIDFNIIMKERISHDNKKKKKKILKK